MTIALVESDDVKLQKAIDNFPEKFVSVAQMKGASSLIQQAFLLLHEKKNKLARQMNQIKQQKKILHSSTSQTYKKLNITL
jgi:gamma-glutamyl:cysteine ligase YbdK (ATP-grasp superfamily)